MLEETATVTQANDTYAWVETERKSSCDTCAVRGGCGTATLAKVLGRRRTKVRATNGIGAQVGDRVVLGLAEGAFLQGSVAVYLVPLGAMMLAAGAGEVFAANTGIGSPEVVSILFGLIGVAGGLAWLRAFSRRIRNDARYQPVLIRKLSQRLPEREGIHGQGEACTITIRGKDSECS